MKLKMIYPIMLIIPGVVALDNYLYFISNYFTSPIGDYNCFRYDLSMRKTEGYLPFYGRS